MTVQQLSYYFTALSTYRIREQQEPEYLFRIMGRDNRLEKIIVPNSRLSLAMKSFCFRGSEQWNKLPEDIRKSPDICRFKSLLKDWIHQNVPQFSNEDR